MYWQVIIPEKGKDQLSATVMVEADNWFSALKSGLETNGADGENLSNISCSIHQDESVEVKDFLSNTTYMLKPVDENGEPISAEPLDLQPKKDDEEAPEPKPAEPILPSPLTGDFSAHDVFFARDEAPEDGSGIFYRERLLSVDPGYQTDEAGRLIHAYFNHLKELGSDNGTKLFISVQVFDHKFRDQALRPAVAALTWKEWNPRKPKILFPLSGEKGVTFSKMPQAPTPAQQKEDPQPKHTPTAATTEKVKPAKSMKVTSSSRPSSPPGGKKKRTSRRTPALTPPPRSSTIDDKMVEAFERMQDIYDVRDHDKSAAFVLSLARELVECEAGSAMLITPGKFELYVSAAEGPAADTLKGKKYSFRKGIVGFATRSSIVVNVSDPENDSRFNSEVDEMSGFKTKSVLCAPIQFEGRTVGAIELINSPRKDGFIQNEANILSYLGSALAEYMTTSLPSREADFSDREFLESTRSTSQSPTAKKKVVRQSPAKKTGTKTTATKANQPGAKKTAAKKTAPKAGSAEPAKKTGKKKGKKKKKRRR
ncbi:MAG: GAF domain-containing protein [Deltaproteobacteria bacterium]|nr:GAF domain-containing protein [Deltaproteobacteria bacterium]